MPDAARKTATYQDLCALPENLVGEIISGELVATPRPSYRHARAASVLGAKITNPFDLGEGGPGGWLILDEPEIHLGEHVLVPDLAGWRRERMPSLPEGNWTDLPPDWVCEVLSPGTFRLDRVRKLPVYAQFGVPHVWMLDPSNRVLEVFKLDSGTWRLLSSHADNDKVRAEPFYEVEIELRRLWGDDSPA